MIMHENTATEAQLYTPPGWARGIVLLVLFAVGTVVMITAVLVPLIIAGYQPVDSAPYLYPMTGDPLTDAKTLKDAVIFGTTTIAITGFLLLPLFILLHKKLVKQSLRPLVGSKPDFWCDFALAFGFTSIFWAGALFYVVSHTNQNPALWISAAPIAALILFIALPFQVYAEELIFRGYLQNWLTTRIGSHVMAMLFQALLFSLLHPGDLATVFLLAIVTTTLTRATQNLGAATAIHLTNNVTIFLLSFNPAKDGTILPDFEFVTPLPLNFPIGTAILILCALFLPRLLARRSKDSAPQEA